MSFRPLARVALACSLFAASCATATFVVQQYEGAALDPSRVAVLRVNGGTPIVVVALDGEQLDYSQQDASSRVHIEILPGVHELEVGNLEDPLRRVERLSFVAEPGRVYRLTLDVPAGGLRPWRPLAWEVDPESDRALARAKGAPEPASSAPSVPSSAASPAPSAESSASAPEPTSAPAPSSLPPSPAPTTSSAASTVSSSAAPAVSSTAAPSATAVPQAPPGAAPTRPAPAP